MLPGIAFFRLSSIHATGKARLVLKLLWNMALPIQMHRSSNLALPIPLRLLILIIPTLRIIESATRSNPKFRLFLKLNRPLKICPTMLDSNHRRGMILRLLLLSLRHRSPPTPHRKNPAKNRLMNHPLRPNKCLPNLLFSIITTLFRHLEIRHLLITIFNRYRLRRLPTILPHTLLQVTTAFILRLHLPSRPRRTIATITFWKRAVWSLQLHVKELRL